MEIERKFLLKEGYDITRLLYSNKQDIKDIYLTDNLRLRNNNDKWKITYKRGFGIEREESEFELSIEPKLFAYNYKLIKVRLIIPYNHQLFEVNIFNNILYKDKNLIIIELELSDKNQKIDKPEWLGQEITDDSRFYGYNLYKLLNYRDFKIT